MIESSCCCSAKNWVKLLLAAVFLPLGGVAFLPLAVNQPNLSVGQKKKNNNEKTAQLSSTHSSLRLALSDIELRLRSAVKSD